MPYSLACPLLACLTIACGTEVIPRAASPDGPETAGPPALAAVAAIPSGESRAASPPSITEPDAAPDGAIHGRVVDARTGGGVAEAMVRLILDGQHRQEMTTSDDGRFSFVPEIAFERAGIWTWPPRDWRWRKIQRGSPTALTPAQREGREEFIFELAQAREGLVRGIAVDEATSALVPDLAFTVRRSKESVEVVTDKEGRFALEIAGGPVKVLPGAGFGRPAQYDQDVLVPDDPDTGPPWRVAFHVAPLRRIVLTGNVPRDPTALSFWTIVEGEAQPRAMTLVRRDEEGLFVRGPTPRGLLRDGQAVSLVVSDEEGFLVGARQLRWNLDELEGPIAFELEETATLEVAVRIEELPTIPGVKRYLSQYRIRKVLEPHALTDAGPAEAWRLGSMKWLTPGAYDLVVGSRNHAPERRALQLEAGKAAAESFDLALANDRRIVHGRMRTESGEPPRRLTVTMSLVDDPLSTWSASQLMGWCATGIDHFMHEIEGGDPGELVFAFPDVPPGDVRVSVGENASVPTEVRIVEGADGKIEIDVLQLDQDGPGMGFRVYVAGEEPGEQRIWVQTRAHEGGPPLHQRAVSGKTLTRKTPSERDFEWAVVAAGYRPVYGTQADFRSGGDGRYFADVQLEHGWGTRVVVTDASGDPLAGVRILADGVTAGWTDRLGTFEVMGETPPKRIVADHPGWRSRGGFPIVPPQSNQRSSWHEIVLEPMR